MPDSSGRGRGRPPADTVMQQIAIRLPVELIGEVDDLVDELKGDPLVRAERSAVIRALITEALQVRKAAKGKARK